MNQREKELWLSEFYAKEGKIQFYYAENNRWEVYNTGPNVDSDPKNWRRKPVDKVVDLSALKDSQIDVELSDDREVWRIGKLITFVPASEFDPDGFVDSEGCTWRYCRPRMDHIHAWMGGDCPLPEGVMVRAYIRNGRSQDVPAASSDWHCGSDSDNDIIAFKVLPDLCEGYTWG